jgi:hypothetical protein
MSVVLIDTSILCEVLQIPGKCQNPQGIYNDLERFIRSHATLLLPVATILETGRHIAQLQDGQVRRQIATNFITLVQQALDGCAPWTVSQPLLDPIDIKHYLVDFPDYAMRGISLGDLTIIKEFDRQCNLHHDREILIWTLDGHMAGHHQDPPHWAI